MNICFISDLDINIIGGVQTNIRNIAQELTKLGHFCTVLCGNPGTLMADEYIDNIHILRFNSPLQKLPLSLKPTLVNYVRTKMKDELKPDIVNVHGYRTFLVPMVTFELRKLGIPYVLSPHFDVSGYNTFLGRYFIKFYDPIYKKSLLWSKNIVVNSQYTKSLLENHFSSLNKDLNVIPHGVPNIFHNYNMNKISNNEIELIYAGVLIELKGVQYIIKTLSKLKQKGISVHLTIVGNGDYKNRLQVLAKNLRVDDMIQWLEPLFGEKLYNKIQKADILILTSKSESFGIIVAEALALGTPTIVSMTTALTEFLLEPGCYGISWPPNSNSLANLIIDISTTDVKVGPFNRIISWKEVAKLYEKIFEDIKS